MRAHYILPVVILFFLPFALSGLGATDTFAQMYAQLPKTTSNDELKALLNQLQSRVGALERASEEKDAQIEQLEHQLKESTGELETEIVNLRHEGIPSEPTGPAFPKWDLQLDAMWMDLKGLDQHAFDVESGVIKFEDFSAMSVSRASKNLDIESHLTFRGEVGYRINDKWRAGASGWFFGEDDDASASVDFEADVDGGFGINWVNMWQTNWFPAFIGRSDFSFDFSDFSMPVVFDFSIGLGDFSVFIEDETQIDVSAENEFDLWTTDLFVTRNIVAGERGFLDMNIGAKLARPNHEKSYRLKNFARNEPNGNFVEGSLNMNSDHEAHYSLLAGPSIGLQGRFDIHKRVRFEGFINQSVLLGKVHQRGRWDRFWRELVVDGGDVLIDETFASVSSPFDKSKSVAIPVTEIKAKLLFDITDNVAFDVGGFFSQWWDMPTAPDLREPFRIWDLEDEGDFFFGNILNDNFLQGIVPRSGGNNWEETERTLRFVGLTFGFTLRH